MKKPAVFIDRDGTLNEEVNYLGDPDQFVLLPGSAEAVRLLNEAGIPAVVVTNQAGVARGFFPESRIAEVHARMHALLEARGARLDGVYYCIHHPDAGEPPLRCDCECRKPKPGLLMRAAAELSLDLARSYMVGDKVSDIQCARNAGAKVVLVKTGYGSTEMAKITDDLKSKPDWVADNLLAAVVLIIEDIQQKS